MCGVLLASPASSSGPLHRVSVQQTHGLIACSTLLLRIPLLPGDPSLLKVVRTPFVLKKDLMQPRLA